MMAMHTLDAFDDDGAPTTATFVAAGRSTATFVLVIGVSLAFMSGGRRVVRGQDRTAVAGGLVVRALLIGVISLARGMLAQESGVEGILPFCAVLFLLAYPLLGSGVREVRPGPWALGSAVYKAAVLGSGLQRGHGLDMGTVRRRQSRACGWPRRTRRTMAPLPIAWTARAARRARVARPARRTGCSCRG